MYTKNLINLTSSYPEECARISFFVSLKMMGITTNFFLKTRPFSKQGLPFQMRQKMNHAVPINFHGSFGFEMGKCSG